MKFNPEFASNNLLINEMIQLPLLSISANPEARDMLFTQGQPADR